MKTLRYPHTDFGCVDLQHNSGGRERLSWFKEKSHNTVNVTAIAEIDIGRTATRLIEASG